MTTLQTIVAVFVALTIVGFITRAIKKIIIVLLITAVISGAYGTTQLSPNKLLTLPNVQYLQTSVVDSVKVTPIFEGGTKILDTPLTKVLAGPIKVIVEYPTKEMLQTFLKEG